MSSAIAPVVAALGGTAIAVPILVFILKRWMSVRIDESVKHEYACQLEEHKAKLQQENAYQLEQHKAELQKELSQSLQEIEARHQDTVAAKAIDKTLFQKFLGVVPPGGQSIVFLHDKDMGSSFNWSELGELDEFWHVWKTQDFEFLDAELEKKKIEFYRCVGVYLEFLGINAFSLDNSLERSAIHPESKGPNSEFWRAKVKEANEHAQHAVEAYEEFVRFGRKNLQC